ncbi:MAG: Lrp/AsnC family transcriptional regulator [Candidatus Abyssubacteria bacterium]
MNLDALDQRIINALSGDMSDSKRPYKDIADQVGAPEDEVLRRIREYQKNGILRRLGAMIAHRVAGVDANGMIVWEVPEHMVEQVGRKLASAREVTHCYARRRLPEWPYNLYTMVHARTRKECERVAKRLSEEVGIDSYTLVFSTREFKKTSPRYFIE